MSLHSSGSSKKKGSRSSSASRRQSSWKSSDKSSWNDTGGPAAEWGDWEWDPQWQREWRSRQIANGSWEYEYRYPERDDVPRTVGFTTSHDENQYNQSEAAQLSSLYRLSHAAPPSSSWNVPLKSDSPVSEATQGTFYLPVPSVTSDGYFATDLGLSKIQSNNGTPESILFEEEEYTESPVTDIPREPSDHSSYAASHTSRQKKGLSLRVPSHKTSSLGKSVQYFDGTYNENEYSLIKLDRGYILIAKPEAYFKLGRIFSTILAEHDETLNEPLTFVVLREGQDFSVCCALQITPKFGLKGGHVNKNWALVFPAGSSPQLVPGEELGMEEFPVIVERPALAIHIALRLDFNKAYTIPHDVKVRNIGRIDRNYLKRLKSAFLRAMGAELSEEGSGATGFAEEDGIEDAVEMIENPADSMIMVSGLAMPAVDSIAALSPLDNIIHSHSKIDTSPKDVTLHGSFKIHQQRDFEFGRLFKILWTEPKGQGRSPRGTEIVSTKFGEDCYTSIRRFVIVRSYQGHCLCLPILTYNRQGTSKPGVVANDHAIIYTEMKGKKGQSVKGMPREEKLSKKPIRVQPLTHRDQLDPLSRINYAKIYTVEYNVKICFIGKIHSDSVKYFTRDYNAHHQPLPEEESFDYYDDDEV